MSRKTQGMTFAPLAECGRFPKRTYTVKESKYSGTFERKKTMVKKFFVLRILTKFLIGTVKVTRFGDRRAK